MINVIKSTNSCASLLLHWSPGHHTCDASSVSSDNVGHVDEEMIPPGRGNITGFTLGSANYFRTILRSFCLVIFMVIPDSVAKPEDTLDLNRFLNDHLASVIAKYPKRFVGAATVPLQNPELAAEELKRCVGTLGLPSVMIGSHINEWNLDERKLDPFYKTAEDLSCPVFIHPWDMETGGRMSKYWLPWLVGKMIQIRPKLRLF
ncbi:2-amino-3-carboxymuconate-6-semialdehyde decarboxylase [Trichonephila clavipes]|nr:2-amino-3-carboxymuconate-6-semialdehyde decarboxylase [Trichonephila clavipes]